MADPEKRARKRASGAGFFLLGWLVIVFVFGGLTVWSVFAPFEGAVMAPGQVTVESRHKAIQHLEGGIVSEIDVTEGSQVEEGDLLIRLDGTAIEAQLASLDARIVDLVAREARLKAERDGETVLAPRALTADLAESDVLADTLRSQAALLEARANARRTELSILTQKTSQLERRIEGLGAEVAAKTRQAEIITEELKDLSALLEKGLTPRPRLLALEREQSELRGQAESLRAEIAATQVQVGETQLQRLSLTEGVREQVITELSEVQTELASLLQERAAARDRLDRLEIRAPRSGMVFGVRTYTVGGVIRSGDPIMHIVPRDDRLVALVRIQPQDIDKIAIGQVARLRFSAFSARETPEIEGRVMTISGDAARDEMTGIPYYEVTVEWPSDAFAGKGLELVPGMPVEAMMQTETRNALSYLTKPLRDSISRTFRE